MHINIPIKLTRKIHVVLVWAILFFALIASGLDYQKNVLSWPHIQSSNKLQMNTDIGLRLTQVKQWITTPDFYDHSVKNTNAPYGGIETPWTRPMDIMLVSGYLLTSDTYPIEQRLMLSATWIPILIGVLSIFFLIKAANYRFKNPYHTGLTIFAFLGFQFAFYNFEAGNADHHSLQTLCFSVCLFLLTARRLPNYAYLMGVTIGIWMWISPEPLMFLIPLYLYWGIKIINNKLDPKYAVNVSIMAFLTQIGGLLIERPPTKIFTVEYDTLSIVYVVFFLFIFIGFYGLEKICTLRSQIFRRYLGTLCLGTFLAIAFHLIFPLFYKGPLAKIDQELFERAIISITPEALPVWIQSTSDIYQILILPIIAVFLSIFHWRKMPAIFLLHYIALISVFFQMRWFYYLETSSILIIARFLPTYLRHIRKGKDKLFHFFLLPYVIIFFFFYVSITPETLKKVVPPSTDIQICKQNLLYNVQMGHPNNFIKNKNAILAFNYVQNGGSLLFYSSYKIPSAYFHRETEASAEMRKLFENFSESNAKNILSKRKIDYLLLCPQGNSWVNNLFDPTKHQPSWVKEKIELPAAPDLKDTIKIRPLLVKLDLTATPYTSSPQ